MNYVTNVYILPPGATVPTGKPCGGCGGQAEVGSVATVFPPACDPDKVQKLICDHGVWKLVDV